MTLQLFKLIKKDRKAFFGALLTKTAIENAGDTQGCLEAINKKALKGMNKAQKVELFNQLTEQVKPEIEDDYNFYFTFTLPERNYALVTEGFTLEGLLAQDAEKKAEADRIAAEKKAERDARNLEKSRIAQAEKAERDALKAQFKKEQEELANFERQEQERLEQEQQPNVGTRIAVGLAQGLGMAALGIIGGVAMGTAKGLAAGPGIVAGGIAKGVGKGIKGAARTSRRNSLKARKANMMAMGGPCAMMAQNIKVR